GIQWLIKNAWSKIDAEFALNEAGNILRTGSGVRVFQIQTSEKIPTRVVLRARGNAGHGSLPRADNPVVHAARAITRLADADQPVQLNTTTRTYLSQLATLPDYDWLRPLLAKLDDRDQATAAAGQIRAREPNLDAMLHTTVSPTMLRAGMKINIIPNTAEVEVDVRRLPTETREEVLARFRRIINDNAVEIAPEQGQQMPATEPSSMTTRLYLAMQSVFERSGPGVMVVPLMQRGATDGSFLRAKGMAVYGVPVFTYAPEDLRAHGNDERLPLTELSKGTVLLLEIVEKVALGPTPHL
ncbi:MAG: M20/M25/M40 family metallo-hydrolase, partial [Acidobacteria bacterium]|nr:M20/M25/M40 family metallo-hydrolase [Acidobacteriota bacterium]